jgi:cytochrome o ubiquinol oxidase operon protein cyoD
MKKPQLHTRHSPVPYRSYVIGFVLSIITTLLAYFAVVKGLWSTTVLIYVVIAIALVQLVVQMVFFLHIGRGSRWKTITFVFTIIVVAIVVIGSIWIMNNLNYNMMDMSPAEMEQYMSENEGI